jgi:glycosyltransferase involved in cell wall biosynthesis
MNLSVIVSCYKPHLQKLLRLLDSINVQTILPYEVIVSCSSTETSELPNFPYYKFKFQILTSKERQNAAKNRNIAADCATGTYLTFIDADDIMHPQRIEALMTAINNGAEFVMHNFLSKSELTKDFLNHTEFTIEYDCLAPAPSGCVVHKYNKPIHHSMSTVLKNCFHKIRFNEGQSYERREDAVFCNNIVRLGVKTGYINEKIAKYDEAGYWEIV